MKLIHLNMTVRGFAGCMSILSAVLVRVLPDMTMEKLPETFADIHRVQFPREGPVTAESGPQTESNSIDELELKT